MGTRFTSGNCPRKFKTLSNRRQHKERVCPSSLSPAWALHQAYIKLLSPKPKDDESSREGRPTGAPIGLRHPLTPSPVPERESRREILQELHEDQEYNIKLEEPNGRETRRVESPDGVENLGGNTPEFHDVQHPLPEAQAGKQRREIKAML